MENQIKNLSWDEWFEKFKPLLNKNDEIIDFHPKVCDKKQLKILEKAKKENRVWTLIEDDNNELIISEGLHIVNRLDVYITEYPYEENTFYIIKDNE